MGTYTAQRTVAHQAVLSPIAAEAMTWIGTQPFLSQARCVDVLLDLYRATPDEFVQWCIVERLRDIRFLNAVVGDDMRADLAAIVALAGEIEPVARAF